MKTVLPKEKILLNQFICGEWVKGTAGQFDVTSPYTGQVIGQVTVPSIEQVNSAILGASTAQKNWAAVSIKERSKVLFNLRNILNRDIDQITHLKSSESGKTFDEAKAGLLKGIEVLEFALSIQNLDLGGKLEVSKGVSCEYKREPLGVVCNITPFNFPAMVPMWTLPIAIVLGNAYVWKPSDKTPLTSLKIANAFKEAGLPDGILTVLNGGADVVNAIIDNPLVKAVGFVGSSPVAKAVYQRTTSLGKRSLALGGAKNHILLLPDANSDLTGPGISDSFTGCAGQRCMAASIVLAVGDVNEHIQKIKARASALKIGSDMGAIITAKQVEFLKNAITQAEKDGCNILLDGRNAKAPEGFEKGNWIGPTIIDNVKPGSMVAKTELFGPVLCIIRCKDITEAMQIVNSSQYGNACSVFTSSGAIADRIAREAKAGMIGVNVGVPVPREPFSFGGVDDSKYGYGDITGENSLNLWTINKKITVKWEKQSETNWMS